MKSLTRVFIRGLVTLLPLVLCVYVLMWFLGSVEELLHQILFAVPGLPYVPGMGIIVGIALILAMGFAMDSERIRYVFSAIEMPFKNVPIVKSIYSAMKDLTQFFSPAENKSNRVVIVRFPQLNAEVVGFVTREDLRRLPDGFSKDGRIAVFLPMSYQLGGFTVFVPKEWVQEINMSVESAMRSSLTAWMPGSGSANPTHPTHPDTKI